MSESELYRRYADECLSFAKEAPSDDLRKTFVDMARTWVQAAAKIEGQPVVYYCKPEAEHRGLTK
jgi:hypothetical protein